MHSRKSNTLAMLASVMIASFSVANVAVSDDKAQSITVSNHTDNETVRYSVVLLSGTMPAAEAPLRIVNQNSPAYAGEVRVVSHKGRFKALVRLAEGTNKLQLSTAGGIEKDFTLNFVPQTTPHYVRLVWMTGSKGETDFAAPTDDFPQDYEARLRTAALLMQTFTAEKMNSLGYGRRTFRLERDSAGRVVVHTWKGSQTKEDYYAMGDSGVWWNNVRQWINQEHPDDKAKNVVLAAYTRKDPRTGEMKGHTALGGANLGLFGSASVFSWPRSIAASADAFLDTTKYDVSRVHDDSVGRSNVWGLASTTIGATLHETGHALGLPHCRDNFGIMRRGFDHFNRCFTLHDPKSGRNREPVYFTPSQEAYFAPVSASALRWSPWLELDQTERGKARAKLRFDKPSRTVAAESDAGVPWMGFYAGGEIIGYKEFDSANPPQTALVTLKEMQAACGGATPEKVRVLTSAGNSSEIKIPGSKK